MAASRLPRGLILDLITPLNPDGDLDKKGLERHLSRVVPHVQGIFIAGPGAGEGEKLSIALRERLLHEVCLALQGRLPLLVWVTQATRPETIQTVELLSASLIKEPYPGDVYWVDTPLLFQSNRDLPNFYREMVERFERGWVLHNDPSLIKPLKRPFKRENIRTSVLKELCALEKIRGLIFSGSLDRAQNYHKAVRSASEFRIYDGEESRFLSQPSLSGLVSAGANLAARAWQKITGSSLDPVTGGEEYPDRLQQIWEAGANVSELMSHYAGDAAVLIKLALFRKGILESPFSYRGEADPQRGKRLLEWLEAHPQI